MRRIDVLASLLRRDPTRSHALEAARRLGLPDCWIGAGFVREAAWDHLHVRPLSPPSGDVDVIWFGPRCAGKAADEELEAELRRREPGFAWSVRNQARMHRRNDDPPYRSSEHAMRHWPETATAVAARMDRAGSIQVAAPFGLGDLLGGVLRCTPAFCGTRRAVVLDRIRDKRWMDRWPRLVLVGEDPA